MRKNTILIVEDNKDDIELALHGLGNLDKDCHVKVLENGESVLEYVANADNDKETLLREVPALVLLDIHLPDISGFDVLKQMRSNKNTKDIPIVIFSSSDEQSDIRRSYDLGANSYIQKPLGYDTFYKALEVVTAYWLSLNLTPSSTN